MVTLNFDDGTADQYQLKDMLGSRGLPATFYLNSGRLDTSGYLTTAQALDIQSAGNEIAGHSINHLHLTQLSTSEATRQICDDRSVLIGKGFPVTDFAYPFGDNNATVDNIVKSCGYSSGRDIGDLVSPNGCSGCAYAETIPPRDPYSIRTPSSVQQTWTLAQLKGLVTQVETHGGGWMNIVFHHICNGCDTYSTSASTLGSFLDFVAGERASGRATVSRAMDVIGGTPPPPPPPPPPPGSNLLKNPSLEADTDADGVPDCWQHSSWGSNSGVWSRVSDAHDGSWADQVNVTSWTSGEQKLLSRQDSGACAPAGTPGHTYTVTAWYKGAGARIVIYYRSSTGSWTWWAQSATGPSSTSWTSLSYTTAALPAGATYLSAGVERPGAGIVTIDDLSLIDSG